MIPSRTLLAAAIALAVVVCTDTPTATDAVDGLAFATVGGPSATGSGHIVDDRSSSLPLLFRNFSFSADGNGGLFQIVNRTFDVRIHGFIDCLTVVGNEAWFAGHVTQSNEDFRVGGIRGFRVVDNGEGENDPPDQIAHSTLLPLSDPLVETAQDWCDKTPENRRLLDIEQGNIQVSSQSAASKRLVGPASVEGEIGPGSLYRLEIPADWNGDLAVYAHGARNVASSIFLGPNTPLQTLLLEKGFGIAHSSFSENGYNIGDAAIRTRQLLGLFNSTFGRPRNTYIHGLSMGGLRALLLVERNPQLFDGAMSVCGMVGGASFSRDQVLNTQVLFDYFYPDVLGGSPIQPEPWLESVEIDVLIALGGV